MGDQGWSIATGSQASDTQLTTSGSCTAMPQPSKFQRTDAAPAIVRTIGTASRSEAEGNLVHFARKKREDDSMSNVSATSSNKLSILRAKLDLEEALLRERKQETSCARLRHQIAEEEEVLIDSPLNLSRDLSAIVDAGELEREAAQQKEQFELNLQRQLHEEVARRDAEAKKVYEQTISMLWSTKLL